MLRSIVISLALIGGPYVALSQTPATSAEQDVAPKASFVTAEPDVRLEVLDWGGSGRPLVFLAGAGQDAHVFAQFAPKFVPCFHVYGITRKGLGKSDAPNPSGSNYSADRLGDDVMAVCDALRLTRPVLVGHSIAGQELSSVGNRFPSKIAGLVYLDAGYSYALYSPKIGDAGIDAKDLQHELQALLADGFQTRSLVETTDSALVRLDRDLKRYLATTALMPPPPPHPPLPAIPLAMINGVEKYTKVGVPVLAIFADPHDFSFFKLDAAQTAAITADDLKNTSAQIDAFQSAIPQARVVRIPNADHFLFRSNEQQVFDDMTSFLSTLPK